MIEFNKPPFIGTELEYIRQAAEENNNRYKIFALKS